MLGAPGKEDNKLKAQECSERMSAGVSSHTSVNSRRSAGNSRSDGRSNHRSDRANSHNEFNGIKFALCLEGRIKCQSTFSL